MFKIEETYIERLSKALEEFDFAVLIITGDDFVSRGNSEDEQQAERQSKPRDNVLFELGLFMWRLGRHRAIMLYDEKQKANLPADLGGIHRATFSTPENVNMTDEELQKAFKAVCKKIPTEKENDKELQKLQQIFKAACKENLNEKMSNEELQILEKLQRLQQAFRIIQTWFPDVEDFIINLKKLLNKKNKRFKLKILLMNKDSPFDIVGARILHRFESREQAIAKIDETIEQLKELKKLVDKDWKNEYLDLEIHQYNFLPFGPFYQVGDEVLFVGFYLNNCSSIHAPMVKIHNTASDAWNKFTEHFDSAWKVENPIIAYTSKTEDRDNSN